MEDFAVIEVRAEDAVEADKVIDMKGNQPFWN
jgi:hypothetical protein